MKKFYLLVALFSVFSTFNTYSQESKRRYFQNFNDDQLCLIEKNWIQHFGDNIYQELDDNSSNMITLRLDSYGLVYPDADVFKDVKFNPKKLSKKNIRAFSIYEALWDSVNSENFKKNIDFEITQNRISKSMSSNLLKFKSLIESSKKWSKRKNVSLEIANNISDFNKTWNEYMLEIKAKEIKEELKKSKYSKLCFFIHGYNVPYSLACVQLISLKKEMKSIGIPVDSVLFVPVFWPSNDQKNCDISKEKVFNIDNQTGLPKGLNNGILFTYYSNQAYYAAITLRKILNHIGDLEGKEQFIFTHSLGATVATTALINTISKLHATDNEKQLISKDLSIEEIKTAFQRSPLLRDLANGFKTPIPSQKITVFMSAPAIPGFNTFKDIDTSNQTNFKNKHFFSTLNLNDEMLTKGIAGLSFVNSKNWSSTTLGCNPFEAKRASEFVNGLNNNNSSFEYSFVSKDSDHDIFTYLDNKEYRDLIGIAFNHGITMELTNKDSLVLNFTKAYYELQDSVQNYSRAKNQSFADLQNFKTFGNYSVFNRDHVNSLGKELMSILYEVEKQNYYSIEVCDLTRQLIRFMTDPFIIVLVERSIKEDNSVTDIQFKRKILNELSKQQKAILQTELPYYSYENSRREAIKFISIRSGNDLFTCTSRNRDRDYTGSFLFEIGTDWLNPKRTRPIKSYQTVFFGFDVFTPAFYDTTKFTDFNSFDTLDRPHASFQYVGWSKKGLSKYNKMRWSYTGKVGVIGGRIGNNFQTLLHQDVSNSLRPKGWDAQIANGGRLGISFETLHEWQFFQLRIGRKSPTPNFNSSIFVDTKIGTYMTNASLGLELSNKTFANNNHNFITQRVKMKTPTWCYPFAVSTSFKITYVVHNTMLEGYGIFKNNEAHADDFTPKSVYFLRPEQVNRLIYTANARLSYTTTYFTLFYNWFVFSPETKLTTLNTTVERASDIDLSKRWHHFAEIGLTFNLNRY
jgi:hypothetical protein